MIRNISMAAALTALAGLLLLAGSPGAAQEEKGAAQDLKAVSDEQFVMLASAADLAEINLGTLATKQAASEGVKKFAQKMIKDHTMSSKELLKIAGAKGFRPAATMDAKHEALATKLAGMKGQEFDRHYMKHMVMDHKLVASLYRAESKHGQDEALKAFAAKTLPVVEQHLKMAESLEKNEGGAGGGAGATRGAGAGSR